MIRRLMSQMTNRWAVALVAVGLAIGLGGCKEANFGPKNPDYAAAHTAHYHPDVHRQPAPTTQPVASSQPTEFHFGGGPLGSPILFVNSEAITVPQVLEPLYDDLSNSAKTLTEAAYRDYLIRQVARQVTDEISGVIIYQEAKKQFSGDKYDEAFAKEADSVITDGINNRYGGVHARYEEHLKAVGLSGSEMKERIKRRIMISQYLHEHFKPLMQNPGRTELFKYYQEHKSEFMTAPKAEMFIIELPFENELESRRASKEGDVVAAAKTDALAKLKRAREELDSGVSFSDAAREYSKGLQAANGGAVGEVSPGSMAGRYQRACEVLFTLEEGQVSAPVQTPEAVFLIKCGKKTPAHQGSFEESQTQIRSKIMEEKFQEMQKKYIQEMEAKAVIGKREEFMLAVLSAAPRPPQYANAPRPPAKK